MKTLAQVSIYPLHQEKCSPAIEAVWQALEKSGLSYEKGSVSTLIQGESEQFFGALKEAFEKAVEFGNVNMVVTIANA